LSILNSFSFQFGPLNLDISTDIDEFQTLFNRKYKIIGWEPTKVEFASYKIFLLNNLDNEIIESHKLSPISEKINVFLNWETNCYLAVVANKVEDLTRELTSAIALLLAETQRHIIHAAMIQKEGQAIFFAGKTSSGKSTLATLLSYNGFEMVGDDTIVLDTDAELAWAFPRQVHYRNEALRKILDGKCPETAKKYCDLSQRDITIVFPSFSEGSGFTPTKIGAPQALQILLQDNIKLGLAHPRYTDIAKERFILLSTLVNKSRLLSLRYDDSILENPGLETLLGFLTPK
jgi:hypothetical protein